MTTNGVTKCPRPARMATVGAVVIPTIAAMLLLTGCGGSSGGSQLSGRNSFTESPGTVVSLDPPTSSSAAASTDTVTWTFTMQTSSGYDYQGTLTLGRPGHFSSGDLPQCEGDPTTAAEVTGTLQLSNEASFPGRPGVLLNMDGLTKTEIADESDCNSPETGYGVAFTSTNALANGQSMTVHVAVVIPDYYSPIHPDGDASLLSQQAIDIYYQVDGQEQNATFQVSGPGASDETAVPNSGIQPADSAVISLGALADL
jgi:hypothetical protein